jgi:hypothetical protein
MMYWIYDLPNWQLAVGIVGSFVVVSVAGLVVSRPLVRRLLGGSARHNDVVSFFFAGIGVFYGLALGLIAVATWENFTEVDGMVSKEGAALAALYRDLDAYPQPTRGALEDALRDYARFIVEKEWPAHREGLVVDGGDDKLEEFEDALMNFEPTREREKLAHAEAIRTLAEVVEQRRLRVGAVPSGLPAALWAVVLVGAVLDLALTYLFWVENFALHRALVALLAAFVGLLVFLTAAMDNPFRGEFSVAPDAIKAALDEVMKPAK